MNKTVIKLLAILGIIGAILGLVFSFLPISELAIIPAIVGLLLGVIAYYFSKKQNFSYSFPRIVMILSLLAIIISSGKKLLTENSVKVDTEFIDKAEDSKEDAIKDIEELDEELNELDQELEDLDDELEEEL
ncbi:hypothetical protein [Urechidicola croceus]|uniref:FUSC family protein n=1 Tax=Urechidicola croceus TaxID=1850246 RepID=A0A1D8P4L1_9FLAO|nr:hypothetical protein [Urechidicola croceus]AOW19487.1 hypothetical protein LPB138_01760 [Urechidicola croceus]